MRWFGTLLLLLVAVSACGKKTPPVARPTPPPPTTTGTPAIPPPPTSRTETVSEPTVIPPPLVDDTAVTAKSLDELNRDSPLAPVYYELDSSDLSSAAQGVLNSNAEILKRNTSWIVTIEGHCDERGTAQYNLALGERRALAARNYLQSLGIASDRLRTISYGKEFPFDPGHNDEAWARNRRAQFVITAK